MSLVKYKTIWYFEKRALIISIIVIIILFTAFGRQRQHQKKKKKSVTKCGLYDRCLEGEDCCRRGESFY